MGLDHYLDMNSNDLANKVKTITDQRGVDIVIDMVGHGVLADNLACTAVGGRIVSVGRMAGNKDEIDLDLLALKRLSLIGVTFRTRTIEEKSELFMRFQKDLFPLFEARKIQPLIERVYPLSDALKAQEYMALNQHLGKIILRP